MTEAELKKIEERLELVETHEEGYGMLWAIWDLIDEVRRLNGKIDADWNSRHLLETDKLNAQREKHIYREKLERLQKQIADAPTVWGFVGTAGSTFSTYPPGTFIQENNTHTAKLIDVQEIKRHRPYQNQKVGEGE